MPTTTVSLSAAIAGADESDENKPVSDIPIIVTIQNFLNTSNTSVFYKKRHTTLHFFSTRLSPMLVRLVMTRYMTPTMIKVSNEA